MILRRPAVPSPSGLSSESAMTSINNTCYSGMVDDNTVDSNISGKRKFAIPSCGGNTSRKLSERSKTNRSMTQNATDGTSLSDQQHPVCSASILSDKNDDIKKLISKKVTVYNQNKNLSWYAQFTRILCCDANILFDAAQREFSERGDNDI